jgi:hypothetical protein
MVEDLRYNFSRGGGEFRFWYPNPSSDPESQRINPNNYFSLSIDTTTLTSAQISASAGERAGDLVGIATRPSVLRDRTVYIASDYANNTRAVVDDKYIVAKMIHEVGNAISIVTGINPSAKNPRAFGPGSGDSDAGAALEECVFGGRVNQKGEVTTVPYGSQPTGRSEGRSVQ